MSSVCVLAVEDERIVALDLKNRLQDLGYEVLSMAASAEEAVEFAQTQLPNVVLMDIRLAGTQDGIDAALIFRERFDIPVVFATAHSDDETIARASKTEPFGYLVKPYGDRELKAALDIAVYKHSSEKRLREANDRLRLSQKVAQLGIWVKDLKTKFFEVSEEANRILGLDSDPEATIEDMFARVNLMDRTSIEEAIQICAEAGEPMQVEYQLDLGNGSRRYVRQYGEAMEDSKGERVRLLGAVQDITQYKLLEEKLRSAQKLEAIGQLAGGVAHDFNNLLIVIRGYSDMTLQALEPGHPLYSRVSEIRKAADRAAALTQQLLAFSGRQVMHPRPIDLNQLINDFESLLDRLIVKGVEINKNLANDLWSVTADPEQIERVIMNLVLNAKDAMPEGGLITIATANTQPGEPQKRGLTDLPPGRYVCLSVTDSGSGISANLKPRLFEPFFTTKAPAAGTGLGLSTLYGIVKQHKGDVSVESEPGQGTVFCVYLPATMGPLESPKQFQAVPPVREVFETVLLVEDDILVRDLLAEILRTNGYKVLLASSGTEALKIAETLKTPIHVMLTDMVMPGMSGPELSKQMSSIRPGIRIILMSGYSWPQMDNEDLSGQKSLFLAKPFSPFDLKRKLEQALAKN